AAPAGHQRNRGDRGHANQDPRESLSQERQQRGTIEIVQVEPLRDTFGIADSPLILERFFFPGHLSISTKPRRAPPKGPAVRTRAERAPAASRAARDASASAPEAAGALRRSP